MNNLPLIFAVGGRKHHQMKTSSNERLVPDVEDILDSPRSQYSVNSSTACTILACEAALRLLSPGTANRNFFTPSTTELLEEIISSCSNIKCDYTDFQEVILAVDRFKQGFNIVEEGQLPLSKMQKISAVAEKFVHQKPVVLMLTKPPESIALIGYNKNHFVVFDSHKRSYTNGAYFAVCHRFPLKFLEMLWPVTTEESANGRDAGSLQFATLNMLQYYVVERSSTQLERLPELNLYKVLHEGLLRRFDELSRRLVELEKRRDDDTKKLDECRQENAVLHRENSELREALGTFVELNRTNVLQHQDALEKLTSSLRQIGHFPTNRNHSVSWKDEVVPNGLPASDSPLCCYCARAADQAETAIAASCQHRICRTCSKRFVRDKMAQYHTGGHKLSTLCPVTACQGRFKPEDVRRIAENEP